MSRTIRTYCLSVTLLLIIRILSISSCDVIASEDLIIYERGVIDRDDLIPYKRGVVESDRGNLIPQRGVIDRENLRRGKT